MKAIYIPSGTKNLKSLFPAINFSDIEEYHVELQDNANVALVTTSAFSIESCADDVMRIHFLNYLGTIDNVNCRRISRQHESKSQSWEKTLPDILDKSAHGLQRFDVRSNELYTVRTNEFTEDVLPWLEELVDTPKAWVEWKGTQGQPDAYLPIVISDSTIEVVKEEDRYYYEVQLSFKMSNERITIRN